MTNIFIHLFLLNQNPVRDSILVKYMQIEINPVRD